MIHPLAALRLHHAATSASQLAPAAARTTAGLVSAALLLQAAARNDGVAAFLRWLAEAWGVTG